MKVNFFQKKEVLDGLTFFKKEGVETNHLGNVLEVVTDRKLAVETAPLSGVVDYYIADVVSQSDYFPFGMIYPNGHEGDDEYRYSFQKQEKDNEIKGDNNSVNYKYRMHDPRVGRFFATDPLEKSYPYNGPYNFSENRVIDGIELEGLEVASTETGFDPVNPTTESTAVLIPDVQLIEKVAARQAFMGTMKYVAIQASREQPDQVQMSLKSQEDRATARNIVGMVPYALPLLDGEDLSEMEWYEHGLELVGIAPVGGGLKMAARYVKIGGKMISISGSSLKSFASNMITSSKRFVKGTTSRGIQALSKKIDRGNEAFGGLKATQENVDNIINSVLTAEKQVINQTTTRQGVAVIDIFNTETKQGIRIIESTGEFDTFLTHSAEAATK